MKSSRPKKSSEVTPSPSDLNWAYHLIQKELRGKILKLILSGEELGAARASLKQILEFRLDEIAKKIAHSSGTYWALSQ